MYKIKSNFLIVSFPGLFILITIVFRFTLYSPPFLDNGNRNFMDRSIDFFSFGWHFTKASVYKDYLKKEDMANKEFAKAGWYRKLYLERKFKVEIENLFSVLGLYKKLDVNSILEKLYISLLDSEKGSDIAFLQEAGEKFIIFKNWEMAVKSLSAITDINQRDSMDYYYLGLSYFNLDKLDHAKFYFEKAAALTPDFADVYYWLGQIARKSKKWKEAKEYFEKALNILPNHLECLKALHEMY